MESCIEKKEEMRSISRRALQLARKFGTIGIQDPEDMAQNAMIKVLNKNNGSPITLRWLSKTVFCVAMDAGRLAIRGGTPVVFDLYEDYVKAVCECPDEQGQFHTDGLYVARKPDVEIDVMPRVRKMLSRLSPPLRQALVLHVEGYSSPEIAAMTNTNVGTVRSRLFYARRRAKLELADLI
jgi:DNA-directed RNA polymerase specialized sigma24 family protein